MILEGNINILAGLAFVLILAGFTFYAQRYLLKVRKDKINQGVLPQKLKIQKVIILILYLVGISGWLLGVYLGKVKDNEIKTNLIRSASMVAEGLNARSIASFTFSPVDLENPAYRRMNEQLRILAQSFKGYEIFTISKKDSIYVYGPSILSSDTVITHIPGTVFIGAQEVVDNIYLGGDYISYGPYFDGTNSVLTGFASVLMPRSTIPVMLVGINMPEPIWRANILKAKLYSWGISLLLLIIIGGCFIVFFRKKMIEFIDIIWWKNPGAIFTLVCGLIITTLISSYLTITENKLRTSIFNQMSSAQASQIRNYNYILEYHMNFAARTIESYKEIDDTTFKKIVTPLFNNSYILKTGLALTKNNFNRGFRPASVLEYVEPSFEFPFLKGSQFPNVTNETESLIRYSLQSEQNNLDGPFFMPLSSKETVCFYFPVKLSGPDKQEGLFFVIAEPNLLLAEAIAVQGPGKALFKIHQIIEQDHSPGKIIASFPSGPEKADKKSKLKSKYPHLVFGKAINYYFTEGEQFRKTHTSQTPILMPLTGVVITTFLSFFIGFIGTRKARLEIEIQARTDELTLSEMRFSDLFTSMNDGVALHEIIRDDSGQIIDFRIIDANPVCLNIWQLTREDVLGKTGTEIFNTNFPIDLKIISAAVNSKIPKQVEYFNTKTQKYYHISVTSWEKDGFSAIFTDFTERKLSEYALKKSEERYRLISDNVGDIIWIYNIEADRFTFMSPSVKKVMGYTPEETFKMGLKDILTPESYNYSINLIPANIKDYYNGKRSDLVTINKLDHITKEGNVIATEVVTTLITDKTGKVIEILGVTRDISEKEKARKDLEQSEEKYRLLVENQQDLITKIDPEGRFIYASSSFCNTFGKKEEELLGKTYIPQIHADDIESSLKALTELNNPPYIVYFQQRVKTVNGWRWLEWQDNTIFNDRGEITGFIGVARDITKQKEYEQELQKSSEKLQSQNEEYAMLNEEYMALNEELRCTNEELIQAIDKAKESENLKTAFLQNMSHEIRTPLNAVIGFSEMFSLSDLSDEDIHDYSEIVVNSSRQLLSIVDDILTISTLETRQERINITPVPLSLIIKELEAVFNPRAKSKGLALITEIPYDKTELLLETDELKLKQVFNNLIGNAIKFTSHGSVKFGYKKKDDKILFYVKDSGIGIPINARDIIFERFRQAENNDTSIYGGTGLGLAISKGHVELMGGTIWVESELDKGSVFYFELPTKNEEFIPEK